MKLLMASIGALVIILNAEANIALIESTNGQVLGPYLIKPIDHAHQDDDKSETIPLKLTGNVYRDDDGSETIPLEDRDNVHQDDQKPETISIEPIDHVHQNNEETEIILTDQGSVPIYEAIEIKNDNKKLHSTNIDLAEDYDINNIMIETVTENSDEKESLEINAINSELIGENSCMSNCTNFTRNHTRLEIIAGKTKPKSYFNITEDDPERTLIRRGSKLQLICYVEKMSKTESDVNITFMYKSAKSSSLPRSYPSKMRCQNTTHHIFTSELHLNESGFFTCKVNVKCCDRRTSVSVQHRIEVWDGDMTREILITAGIAASLAVAWALITYLMSRRQKEKKKRFIKNVLIPSSLNESNTLKSRVILMSSNDSLDSFE